MGGGISRIAKRDLLVTLRDRYRNSSKMDKTRILDEFIAITGHHRKHGIRLLGELDDMRTRRLRHDASASTMRPSEKR